MAGLVSPTALWPDGVLVVTPKRDVESPMWQKMWERAGYAPTEVRWVALEHWDEHALLPDTHTLIVLGEYGLQTVCEQSDLFRWRGRLHLNTRWGRDLAVLATLRVVDLLNRPTEGAVTSQLQNRPTRYQGVWVRDVQTAIAQAGTVRRLTPDYLLDPKTPEVWQRWVSHALTTAEVLAFDIETQYTPKGVADEGDEDTTAIPEGAILRVSFAIAPGIAASVPWQAEFWPGIRQLLESPLDKVGWNCLLFDVPRLTDAGFPVHGTIFDAQDAWHLLESDLPKGLEWVSSFYATIAPWKHISDQYPAQYAAIDADVTIQNWIGIRRDLEAFGQWDLFQRHVTELMPLLWRAGRHGNLIDTAYRDVLRADMEAEKARISAAVQSTIPDAIRPTKRVKSKPSDPTLEVRPVQEPATVKVCPVCQAVVSNKSEHQKGRGNPCKGATLVVETRDVTVYDLLLPFNLGSSDQLKAYATHCKHPVGFNHKTKQATMDKTHLEKLAKKYGDLHPVYREALRYNQVAKTLSTYMYTPDEQGLIHTTYVNAPSTWRLASRNVNLQNVGKRESNPWAKKARRQIVARPGHVFVQADSTSIEAVVTGYLIGDPNFTAVAKKSIHAYLVCAELGIEFTDAHVELVKRQHKQLYNQFKTAVYLLLYGGDPYLMFMTNPELYPTKAAAEEIQQKIFRLMPKLPEWQARVREQAKREGVLQSPWGYRHKFYDVYTFKRDDAGTIQFGDNGEPLIKLGSDAKRALAFIPQNCAGAFCRDTLRLLGLSEWGPYMPANVSVHDGYTLEVPEERRDEAIEALVNLLTRPVVELGDLRIGCEVDAGYNWADWSPDNPRGMKTVKTVVV